MNTLGFRVIAVNGFVFGFIATFAHDPDLHLFTVALRDLSRDRPTFAVVTCARVRFSRTTFSCSVCKPNDRSFDYCRLSKRGRFSCAYRFPSIRNVMHRRANAGRGRGVHVRHVFRYRAIDRHHTRGFTLALAFAFGCESQLL